MKNDLYFVPLNFKPMRKNFLLILFLIGVLFSNAQSNDPALNKRLSEYLVANKELNFEKIMEYIHPKLFEMVPKELMIQAMKETFENEELKASLDSMEIISVGEVFDHESASYRKIDYSLVMDLSLANSNNNLDSTFINLMKASFEEAFGDATVTYSYEKKSFHISGKQFMIAVRDKKDAPWMFLGYKKDNTLIQFLFPKAVIEKFNLL
jgi:hypothetical protein